MVSGHVKKCCAAVLGGLLAIGCIICFFLPFSVAAAVDRDSYIFSWDDGTITQESYFSAYRALDGVTGTGITLSRGGRTGTVPVGENFSEAIKALSSETLPELLSFRTGGLSRLEQAALCRYTRDTLWYSSEQFIWDGERISRTDLCRARKVILLDGTFSDGFLTTSGATELEVCAEAEVTADDLIGSAVERFSAHAPWRTKGDALYVAATDALRLVAAVPVLGQLSVSEDTRFCDKGCLLMCEGLQSLTLPFVGSAKSVYASVYDPFFAYLFTDGEGNYRIPESLKQVCITGGVLKANAFYGADGIEEIDVCAIEEKYIENDAFVGLPAMKMLHTKKKNALSDGFSVEKAACGCYIYRRTY